jgi:hypothetical protein
MPNPPKRKLTRRIDMSKFDLNFQNLADVWSKEQIKNFRFNAKLMWRKSEFIGKKLWRRDWKNDFYSIETFYYANRAVLKGASKNLPYSTLSLLGELLSHDYFRDEVQRIIDQNVLKFEGQYYKLDDSENQTKVRKALRSYKFQSVEKKAA